MKLNVLFDSVLDVTVWANTGWLQITCFIISRMNPDDLQKLVTMKMPFGKHQGKLLADLPGNYLNWFAREGFPKGEIGRLLALMQEIDHNGLSHLLKPLRNTNPN